jgi:hypothetical protein
MKTNVFGNQDFYKQLLLQKSQNCAQKSNKVRPQKGIGNPFPEGGDKFMFSRASRKALWHLSLFLVVMGLLAKCQSNRGVKHIFYLLSVPRLECLK